MTLEKKDMDRLSSSKSTDRKYPDFLGRMEKGKYYSQSEMTSLVLNKPVAIDKSLLDQKGTRPIIEIERFSVVIRDISFVNYALEIRRH